MSYKGRAIMAGARGRNYQHNISFIFHVIFKDVHRICTGYFAGDLINFDSNLKSCEPFKKCTLACKINAQISPKASDSKMLVSSV